MTVNGLALDTTTVPCADLVCYDRNPRQGNVNAIASSLEVLGQYRPIVVNTGTHTGRASEVLAGNHTLQAARKLDWATIRAVYVDVDDDTAARIVAADNRTSDLAHYDDRLLLELLSELPDLDGTGYDPGDLDDLIVAVEPAGDDTAEAGERTPQQRNGGEPEEGFNRYEHRDEWENAGRRMVILDYPLPTYVWAQEQLTTLAERYGTDSNADTVLRLINDVTGEEPPTDA